MAEIARAQRALRHGAGGKHKGPARSRAGAAGAVHEARKSFKKIRSLLRLARSGLDRKEFRKSNRFFRDAGREIRAVRDAAALIEALDGLSRRYFKRKPPAIVGKLRRMLAADARRLARELAAQEVLSHAARRLEPQLKRVKAWKLGGLKWKDAISAWGRASRKCRQARAAAQASAADERLHQWRKRVKDLWQQTLLLRSACPELRERMEELQTLADLLGEDRDLALLAAAADRRRDALALDTQMKTLTHLIQVRREELRAEAFGRVIR